MKAKANIAPKLITPGTQPPTESIFGDDDYVLRWCAQWRSYRAKQLQNWAEHDIATMYNNLPNPATFDQLTDPMGKMFELQEHLGTVVPRTMQLARELLRVVLIILAYRQEHPEGTLAAGPILPIIRNVIDALENLDGRMPLVVAGGTADE